MAENVTKVLKYLEDIYAKDGMESVLKESIRLYELTPVAMRHKPIEAVGDAYDTYRIKWGQSSRVPTEAEPTWKLIFQSVSNSERPDRKITQDDVSLEEIYSDLSELMNNRTEQDDIAQHVSELIESHSKLAAGQYMAGMAVQRLLGIYNPEKLYTVLLEIRYYLENCGYKLQPPDPLKVADSVGKQMVEHPPKEDIEVIKLGRMIFNYEHNSAGWAEVISKICGYPTLVTVNKAPTGISALAKHIYTLLQKGWQTSVKPASWFSDNARELAQSKSELASCQFMAGYVLYSCEYSLYLCVLCLQTIRAYLVREHRIELTAHVDRPAITNYLDSAPNPKETAYSMLRIGALLFKESE